MKIVLLLLLCTFSLQSVLAIDNGLGRTPAMGYNTWNDFRCNISAQDIKDAAQAIIDQNLHTYGYQYVNMDDCWAAGRYENGTVYPDPETFPNGVKDVADFVHSLGLKFGIYTDRGTETCQGRPGSYGYETIDADTYASWGVDYLKEDSCYATQDHSQAFAEYGKMRDGLNATGRHIYFSLCGWNSWYSPVGNTLGNSWRIAGDCNVWENVLVAMDTNAPLYPNAGPGGWNDPDMLLGSSTQAASYLTPIQSRTMFSQWAVMAAPLLIGSNILKLPAWDLETYTNPEVIAVNQDVLGKQGIRISGTNLSVGDDLSTDNVWARELTGGAYAMIFLNNANDDKNVTCSQTCFQRIGISSGQEYSVRDLWQHTDNGTINNAYISTVVPGQGGSVIIKLAPTSMIIN